MGVNFDKESFMWHFVLVQKLMPDSLFFQIEYWNAEFEPDSIFLLYHNLLNFPKFTYPIWETIN